jgi:hypothetical protein
MPIYVKLNLSSATQYAMAGTSVAAEDIVTGENEPQQIRITSGGKIQTWVSFALDFFEVCACALDLRIRLK